VTRTVTGAVTTATVTIRPADREDWRLWRELRLRALADTPDDFGELLASAQQRTDDAWLASMAREPLRELWIAERDGIPVGMAVLKIRDDDTSRANLYAMWVAPEGRRCGAGRALVDAALRWARSRAALEVEVRVSEGNVPASVLYAATGFVDTGRREPIRPGSERQSRVLRVDLPVLVMGVVNVTPDSFSDGGVYLDPGAAVDHGLALWADGADILDVGGEATNPKASAVRADEELRRVLPVIERLAAAGATVSIDTTKAVVARAAVAAGARIVNDVAGGLFDPTIGDALADLDVTYIAGHLRGRTLSEVFTVEATATWGEVCAELTDRLAALPTAVSARTWVDPGLGFGKGADPATNRMLIDRAGDLGHALGRPVVVGASRKRFVRTRLGGSPDLAAVDAASVAASLDAVRAGAHVIRAHNVALLRAALAVYKRE
jgi:dihydropteroate synthase